MAQHRGHSGKWGGGVFIMFIQVTSHAVSFLKAKKFGILNLEKESLTVRLRSFKSKSVAL